MKAEINKNGKLEINTNNFDLCYKCKNIYKCPLIQAITKEYVILHYEDIEIKECGLFKK